MKGFMTNADDDYTRHDTLLMECSHLICKNVTNQITPHLEYEKILKNDWHCRFLHVKSGWH